MPRPVRAARRGRARPEALGPLGGRRRVPARPVRRPQLQPRVGQAPDLVRRLLRGPDLQRRAEGRRVQIGWAQGIALPRDAVQPADDRPVRADPADDRRRRPDVRPAGRGAGHAPAAVAGLADLEARRRPARPGRRATCSTSGSRPRSATAGTFTLAIRGGPVVYDAGEADPRAAASVSAPLEPAGRVGPAPDPGRSRLGRGLRQRRPGRDLQGSRPARPGRAARPDRRGRGDPGPVPPGPRVGLVLGRAGARPLIRSRPPISGPPARPAGSRLRRCRGQGLEEELHHPVAGDRRVAGVGADLEVEALAGPLEGLDELQACWRGGRCRRPSRNRASAGP